jgi:hypothetical protein
VFLNVGASVNFIVMHAFLCSRSIVLKVDYGLRSCMTAFIGITVGLFVGLLVLSAVFNPCSLIYCMSLHWLMMISHLVFYCRAQCELGLEFGCDKLAVSFIVISNFIEALAVCQ